MKTHAPGNQEEIIYTLLGTVTACTKHVQLIAVTVYSKHAPGIA